MIKKYLENINKFIEQNRYSGIAIALVFYVLVALLCFTRVYEVFELKLYDLRFGLRPSIQEWERLYFVDIDENSLTTVGQFPWPRNIYSEGLKTLKDIHASQVCFDIMFPDASPKSIDSKELDKLVKKADAGVRIKPAEIETVGINKDSIFADGVKEMDRVILSYTFSDEPLAYDVLERQKKAFFVKARARFLEKASAKVPPERIKKLSDLEDLKIESISYPIPELMNFGHAFGFVNRYTDIDGTIRKVQLVRLYQGRLYFNLALMMLMDLCRVPVDRVDVLPGERIVLKKAVHPVTQNIEDIAIPIDNQGMMYVTWAGSGQGKGGRREKTFHLVPFYALLEYAEKKDFVSDRFNIEDKIKQDELNDLNEQLENFTREYNAAGPAFKKTLKAGLAEIEKKIRNAGANPFLSDLAEQLKSARREYDKSGTVEQKKKAWDKIALIKKKMNHTKLGYLKNYENEIAKVQKELKKHNTAELRDDLNKLRYTSKAMDLAIRVEDLRDRSILVGLTATGSQDIGAIPLHNEYARVGTYHNTVNTIIQKQFIIRVNWLVNLALMLIIALAMGFAVQRFDAKESLVTILATFIVLNMAIMSAFALYNVWLQQLGIVLSMLMPSLAIVSIKFMKEESQKRFIKSAFSYYLSPSVIDEIIKEPESLKLGGEDREITIFFSDIQSFSTISEKLSAQELVERLNEYFTEMTDIILNYGGTVDKFIGDAIMAFYGAPVMMADHPLKACVAAIDMKKRLRELQEQWRTAGLVELHARIGIHTGNATVGNMGSRNRMDYTTMGDAVNLASRLEGANKYYSTGAMMSGTTYERARDHIDVRHLDVIRVVGKSEPVSIYELLGKKGAIPDKIYDMLEKYDRGREYFIKREWKEARQMFREGLKIVPDDGPCRVYIERCESYVKNPPKRGWDGVYVLKGK